MKILRPKMVNYKVDDFPTKDEFNVCELKFDGIYASLLIEDGTWEVWSRSGRLVKSGEADPKIGRTLLQTEFLFASEWAKDRPEFYGMLAVFDAAMIDGADVSSSPLHFVRELIEVFLSYHQDPSFIENVLKRCFLVKQWPIEDAAYVWTENVGPEGFEGIVFKNSEGCWGQHCGRMKRKQSVDYVCMNFGDSDSDRYMGVGVKSVIGGLYVNGVLKETCNVGGLTDEQRVEYYNNPEEYIGLVFEAEGYRVSKRGSLRHPNFKCWRDPSDKEAKECIWP